MPPRLSRPSTSGTSGNAKTGKKKTQKSQKRALNAFTAAQHEVTERSKMRKHRLGEVEPEQGPKRRRVADEDDERGDEEEDDRRGGQSSRPADDSDYGSDSSGNHWRMGGPIGEDSDSSLDSDEAFGESDEERFEGFTFRGSSTNDKTKTKRPRLSKSAGDEMDLNEDGEVEEDDFGEDGVDLATMLDNPVSEEDEESGEEGDTEEDDEDSDTSVSDAESDDAHGAKISKLQDLVASLEGKDQRKTGSRDATDAHESQQPSDYGVTSAQKLKIADLLPTVTDPALRKSLKVLAADKPSKRAGIPGKLVAPLPKRQQARLDRTAATAQANKELEKWQDTVVQNRRAEHLYFPLADPNASEPVGKNTLASVVHDKPRTGLESAIQNILEESGLSAGRKGEEEIAAAEELQMKDVPIEEIMARRAALRQARDLLFREELKAKRIKKIKSKSYRRVHRKERERQAEKARAEMGPEELEDEKEAQDRRRAEERMGAKHRDSKWAKMMKSSGRNVWDDEVRDGVVDMARRNEELRRRIEGKDVEREDSDVSDDDPEDESDFEEGPDAERARLSRQLDRVDKEDSRPQKGLAGMAFMRRAEAAKKAQNDEAIADLRRTLAAEDGESVDEQDKDDEGTIGRRVFGPKPTTKVSQSEPKRPVLEEPNDSAAESDDGEAEIIVEKSDKHEKKPVSKTTKGSGPLTKSSSKQVSEAPVPIDDVWSKRKPGSRKNQKYTATADAVVDIAKPAEVPLHKSATPGAKTKPATSGKASALPADDSDSDSDSPAQATLSSTALSSRAFAGDDVELAFESEKAQLAASEDEKEVSTHLPGWGNWTGTGLSAATNKRNAAQRRHNPLFKTKVDGVRQADRRDAALEGVIISEAGVRKSRKYLAPALPKGFERKEHYERSLRVPIGPEWNAKEVFQRATKPRVIVGRGNVEAISRPMV